MNENPTVRLRAVEVYFHPCDENDCATAGFRAADDSYLLLSRSLSPTEQDKSLGLDGVHIELNDQGFSCYDGVLSAVIYRPQLEFVLNEKGIRNLKSSSIEVTMELPPERFCQLKQVLGVVFSKLSRFSDCS
jgi:hypothetical protein